MRGELANKSRSGNLPSYFYLVQLNSLNWVKKPLCVLLDVFDDIIIVVHPFETILIKEYVAILSAVKVARIFLVQIFERVHFLG